MFTPKQLHNFRRKINFNGPLPDQSKSFYAGLGPCHEWLAGKSDKGYGTFKVDKKTYSAHRVSWMISNGPINTKKFVLHKCDNRKCVNPDHLFLGCYQSNSNDMIAKSRGNKATGDRNGSRKHPERLARGEKSGMHTKPESRRIGELNGKAKLTSNQVKEIKRLYSTGEITQKEIAKQFQIGTSQINRIVRNLIWKSLL
jgi:hypothetical protein